VAHLIMPPQPSPDPNRLSAAASRFSNTAGDTCRRQRHAMKPGFDRHGLKMLACECDCAVRKALGRPSKRALA